MPLITSILIHYQRSENMKKIIEGIRHQTIQSDIIVWDNSGDCPGDGVDVMIRSSHNFHCLPRVLIAGTVKTEYIYNQDDDLAINDKFLFEKFITMSKRYPDYVIGWNGRQFHKDINWEKAYSFPNKGSGGGWWDYAPIENETSIDMINFGVSFLRTELINQIKINPFVLGYTEEEYKYGDDIIISSQLQKKRTMDFKLLSNYEWLNEFENRGGALSKQSRHMVVRDELCRRIWEKKYNG